MSDDAQESWHELDPLGTTWEEIDEQVELIESFGQVLCGSTTHGPVSAVEAIPCDYCKAVV